MLWGARLFLKRKEASAISLLLSRSRTTRRKALRRHTFRHALQRSSPVFVVYWLYSLCRACAVLVFSAYEYGYVLEL